MCAMSEDILNNRFYVRLFLKTVFHCLGAFLCYAVMAVGSVISFTLTEEQRRIQDIDNIRKYVVCYLTNWNYSFQTLFLSLALAHDVLEWINKHESRLGNRIRYWRDVIFTALVVPFTCFVTGMFWSVYSIDRELVFPKVYDAIIPWWFNHCVHTNIAVVIAAETLLQPRRQPVNKKLEVTLSTVVSVLYAVVYYSIYFFAHRWLYGVFGIMTWWQVCLFQLFIWTSVFFFYWIQFPLNRMVHGPEPDKLHTKEANMETKDERTVEKTNGIVQTESYEERNGTVKNPDLLSAPFATKSWSLKYRLIRDQFENSRL
ncbi:androgen-dependent TFPI-regulating protein-like isoform X2 [Plodia interpunctella]|uniref:androgen-dependent TFPI-regulating protein-like isoform X2 n=1 Tax=Plodia interpunctella TaxID=58824 RepID=UPI0023680B1C|nr:androgen-dependent TFPI-regulating protein-like isoform X3 [Plodia interpunctella]